MRRGITAIRRWWEHWMLPADLPRITRIERERARKTMMLRMTLVIAFCATTPLGLPLNPKSWIAFGFDGLVMAALILNKRRHLTTATSIYLGGLIATIAVNLLMNPPGRSIPAFWDWLPIVFPAAIAGLFLPFWAPLAFAVAESLIIAAIFWLQREGASPLHALPPSDSLHFLIYVNIMIIGLAILSAIFARTMERAVIEADRSEELTALNEELEAGIQEIADQHARGAEQQAFLDTILDNIAPDVLMITDERDRVVFCNDAAYELFGWRKSEIIGRSTRKIFADKAAYAAFVLAVYQETRQRQRAHLEHDCVARDGRVIRLEMNVTWLAKQGIYITIARDVTERHAMEGRLQAALQESERSRSELTTVFDTVRDALIVHGGDGHVQHANRAYKALFGEPGADEPVDGQAHLAPATTIVGAPVPVDATPLALALRETAPVEPVALRYLTLSGATLIAQTSAAPLTTMAGEPLGGLTVLRDITAEYRNAHNLSIISAVAHACATAAEEAAVAQAALLAIMEGLAIQNGFIITRDPHHAGYGRILGLRIENALSVTEAPHLVDAYSRIPIAPDAPLMSLRVLATGTPEFEGMPDACLRSDADTPYIGKSIYEYSACVPLLLDGATFGVLALAYNRTDTGVWEAPDRDLLQTVASEIATSLHRARLFEEARRLALFDPLTELHNHRALQDILQQRLYEATAEGAPLSLIMLDIDHFRKFNETYGHDVGDRALRVVANAIRDAIRKDDHAARYGGEEFTIVLPATTAAEAGALAERIRAAIADQRLATGADWVSLTASLGHATFPAHASAAASLVKAADLALYAAKRGGRDRVEAYTPTLLQSQPRANVSGLRAAPQEISLPTGADMDAVQALITAIDLRDGYTAAHSDGVSRYAVAIAEDLKLAVEEIEALRIGGLIHDVGKIGVSDNVLRKPGKLDDAEFALMKAHTAMGEEILRPVEQLHHLIPLVRWHHERLDGSGYPDGLKGDQISLLVRILMVADVFEAFTAERPYHPARPALEGMRFLQQEARAGHMDARVVAILGDILTRQGMLGAQFDAAA